MATSQHPAAQAGKPHWSVERNLAGDGWIRLVATPQGTCAVACDRMGNVLEQGR